MIEIFIIGQTKRPQIGLDTVHFFKGSFNRSKQTDREFPCASTTNLTPPLPPTSKKLILMILGIILSSKTHFRAYPLNSGTCTTAMLWSKTLHTHEPCEFSMRISKMMIQTVPKAEQSRDVKATHQILGARRVC